MFISTFGGTGNGYLVPQNHNNTTINSQFEYDNGSVFVVYNNETTFLDMDYINDTINYENTTTSHTNYTTQNNNLTTNYYNTYNITYSNHTYTNITQYSNNTNGNGAMPYNYTECYYIKYDNWTALSSCHFYHRFEPDFEVYEIRVYMSQNYINGNETIAFNNPLNDYVSTPHEIGYPISHSKEYVFNVNAKNITIYAHGDVGGTSVGMFSIMISGYK